MSNLIIFVIKHLQLRYKENDNGDDVNKEYEDAEEE